MSPTPSPIVSATLELFERYGRVIDSAINESDPLAGNPRLSLENLRWMCAEALARGHELPLDKSSRWLGFVQGCLAMRGLIAVDEERRVSRVLFHDAYARSGTTVPQTLEKPSN